MKFNAIKLYEARGWGHDFREIISINTVLALLQLFRSTKIKCRVLINHPVSATLNMTIGSINTMKHLATHIFLTSSSSCTPFMACKHTALFNKNFCARLQFKCTRLSSIAVHHFNFDEAHTHGSC